MSFLPAMLGLIFKQHRMCLKALPVIGQFNLSNVKYSINEKRVSSRLHLSGFSKSACFKYMKRGRKKTLMTKKRKKKQTYLTIQHKGIMHDSVWNIFWEKVG